MLNDEYTREHTKERVIRKSVTVDAPVSDVWSVWTTNEGAESFFAPRARIVLVTGGAYELTFANDSEGRSSEGCEVIGYEAEQRLSFNWNAPTHPTDGRHDRTIVEIHFEEIGPERTSLVLTHSGWKEGGEWDAAYKQADAQWDEVLGNLQRLSSDGPVKWK